MLQENKHKKLAAVFGVWQADWGLDVPTAQQCMHEPEQGQGSDGIPGGGTITGCHRLETMAEEEAGQLLADERALGSSRAAAQL